MLLAGCTTSAIILSDVALEGLQPRSPSASAAASPCLYDARTRLVWSVLTPNSVPTCACRIFSESFVTWRPFLRAIHGSAEYLEGRRMSLECHTLPHFVTLDCLLAWPQCLSV